MYQKEILEKVLQQTLEEIEAYDKTDDLAPQSLYTKASHCSLELEAISLNIPYSWKFSRDPHIPDCFHPTTLIIGNKYEYTRKDRWRVLGKSTWYRAKSLTDFINKYYYKNIASNDSVNKDMEEKKE